MKVTYILPAIGKKKNEKYIGTWKMEPLTIAVLKSLTPPDVETVFFDDRIELIDYTVKTDIVAISVETYSSKRSYEIASKFRARGVTVVGGGYHVTLLPDEAALHFDSLVCGNAEEVWAQLLSDFEKDQLKPIYKGLLQSSNIAPDRSIFQGKKYLPVNLVETGRGCIHRCEFCAIAGFYQCKYFKRDVSSIVRDIINSPHPYFFLVDDNLVADIEHAKELFRALIPLKIRWAGQGTLSMAKDPELLSLMKQSGCELILIGFESLEQDNLKQMHKKLNKISEVDNLVDKIHKAGIGIYATFVFGYDLDSEQTVNRTVDFAKKHKFYTAAFNHLLPFPGTELYSRLKANDKLIYDKWWLSDSYIYGDVSFYPNQLSAESLSNITHSARKNFASFATVMKRGVASLSRTSILLSALFWALNLRLGKEIDEKMRVPIGKNLDELPK